MRAPMEKKALRLRAEDAEDLAIFAAILQDARAPLMEMVYDHPTRRFMVAFHRYMRECQCNPEATDELCEIQSVVMFEQIEAVRYCGLDLTAKDTPLTLLTIATRPGRQRLIDIDLIFAGGAIIRLQTDCIRCRLEDFGEPQPCTVRPDNHFADEVEEESVAGPA